MLIGVVNPNLKLISIKHGTSRIVGAAQINYVSHFFRKLGNKMVLGSGGHVNNICPTLRFLIIFAGATSHGIGINIHRIHGIAHSDDVINGKDVSDIAAVTLGAIGNKDLIFVHLNAARAEIVIGDSLAKKIVALFRTVAMEGFDARHIVDSRMHRIDYGRRQRSSHIAYAHFYQVCIGMRR